MTYNRPLKNTLSLFLLFLLLSAVSSCTGLSNTSHVQSPYVHIEELEAGQILHVPTGTLLTEDELTAYLASSRIVYIGESHRNVDHHRVQLDIIKALHEKAPGTVTVGMEMFQRPSQEIIDKWSAGVVGEKELFKRWVSDWGYNFALYREILSYLKENNIPLVALNISRKRLGIGHHGNHKKETKEDKKEEPLATLDPDDPYHRAMIEAVYGDPSHGGVDFDAFYRIQLLWEETMAETAVKYLESKDGKGRTLIVLTGGGHVNY
ncbi:MAG: ChaN family lipoprotein, partial [Thermodesulfobacteriota bacterium]